MQTFPLLHQLLTECGPAFVMDVFEGLYSAAEQTFQQCSECGPLKRCPQHLSAWNICMHRHLQLDNVVAQCKSNSPGILYRAP